MMKGVAFLLVLGLLAVAIKLAAFVAIIVCLMRWPKETVGVLAAIAALNLIGHFPVAAGIPMGMLALMGFHLKMKEIKSSA